MAYDFSGKKAIVTGGGRGIGRAIVEGLSKNGAEVWAVSRTKEELDKVEQEIPNTHGVQADLSDWNATKKAIEAIGPVDFLVNNAAIIVLASLLDIKPEDFDTLYNTNVKSIICVSQVVAKGMIESGKGGSIVNMSSQASERALKEHILYCGTKGAVDAISRVMALELGPHKIRVNTVHPTVVMTAMGRQNWSDPARSQPMLDRIPLGRFAEEVDVANATLFLLSDQASMIHGVHLPVDGGFWTT
ncbi:L-xylulose reductase-like [Lineus longissimus]|uniref:L-xylulose reductase-like n=1 Tax=Lineus longissimus TaxID=88925 RepID=UPI002B4E9FDC